MNKILTTVVVGLVILFTLSQIGCRSKLYQGPTKKFSQQAHIPIGNK